MLFPDNKVLGPEKIMGLSSELEKKRERGNGSRPLVSRETVLTLNSYTAVWT